MNEVMTLGLAGFAGLLLGGIFFGGLWWTVRKGVLLQRPAPLIVGSFALRTVMVLAGFYLVGDGHVGRLLLCLLGFVFARILVTWLTRLPIGCPCTQVTGGRNAP